MAKLSVSIEYSLHEPMRKNTEMDSVIPSVVDGSNHCQSEMANGTTKTLVTTASRKWLGGTPRSVSYAWDLSAIRQQTPHKCSRNRNTTRLKVIAATSEGYNSADPNRQFNSTEL